MYSEFEFAEGQHVGECVFVQRGVLFRERQWLSELCGWKIRDTRWFLVWLSGRLHSDGRRHLCDLRSGQVQGSDSRHELHVLRCRNVHARGRRYGLSVVCCKRGRRRAEGGVPVQCGCDRERERVCAVCGGQVQGRDRERELYRLWSGHVVDDGRRDYVFNLCVV